ncbi:hypothetical protein [Pedobacter sp. Leaf250]|uniref:hypothetical protein n=1 Tax=Pedobacter sp. Leaf250 TaxID=2876559 RepID=UPI001E55DA54|nr:hypothetical protein [Pedobacter sp. Leaf250]
MKLLHIKFLTGILFNITLLSSCDKLDTDPVGVPELENYYYAGFFSIPWNNTGTASVLRNQTALVKFPVKFHSSYLRDYDPSVQYSLITTGITNPAVVGQDFEVVDKSGNRIQPTNGIYNLVFPKAETKIDTLYFKVLNNSLAGTRRIEINLVTNTTQQYTVGTFTQAFKRFIEIR